METDARAKAAEEAHRTARVEPRRLAAGYFLSRIAPTEAAEAQRSDQAASARRRRVWAGSGDVSAIGRWVGVTALVIVGTALLIVEMTPQTTWQSIGFSADGPLPHALAPLEAVLYFAIPALIGALCRRWQAALVLATLPAWIDLGVFAVAAAGQLGPFYLTQSHPDGAVGTLELFGALGAAGWLARRGALWLESKRPR